VDQTPHHALARRDAEDAEPASDFARIYHSRARVRWVKSLPCVGCTGRPSENAHTENGGMGRKADYPTIAPLCSSCHGYVHRYGIREFERAFGINLKALARATQAAWERYAT
jgi:hypothetical protein